MKTNMLGEQEMKIMDIIWEKKQCSTLDVVNEIKKDRNIAYTTVSTVLKRLCEKGFVIRSEDTNHFYLPKLSKSAYTNTITKSFLKNIFNTFGDVALTSFAKNIDELPTEKKQRLLQLLKEKQYENK